ncbi:MAG: hypothetical protein FJX72_18550 [Armatimonadetes bacterium]|nr:hypothetical protein [Armatimonadota bacterium]
MWESYPRTEAPSGARSTTLANAGRCERADRPSWRREPRARPCALPLRRPRSRQDPPSRCATGASVRWRS